MLAWTGVMNSMRWPVMPWRDIVRVLMQDTRASIACLQETPA
jgi:hypothetical protein